MRDVGGSQLYLFSSIVVVGLHQFIISHRWMNVQRVREAQQRQWRNFSHLLKLSLHLCHIVLTDFSIISLQKYTYSTHSVTASQRGRVNILSEGGWEEKNWMKKLFIKNNGKAFSVFWYNNISLINSFIEWMLGKSAWFNRFFIMFHEHLFGIQPVSTEKRLLCKKICFFENHHKHC